MEQPSPFFQSIDKLRRRPTFPGLIFSLKEGLNESWTSQTTQIEKCDLRFASFSNDLWSLENGGTALCRGPSELIQRFPNITINARGNYKKSEI